MISSKTFCIMAYIFVPHTYYRGLRIDWISPVLIWFYNKFKTMLSCIMKSYRFGMTWGWLIDVRPHICMWTIPLRQGKLYRLTCWHLVRCRELWRHSSSGLTFYACGVIGLWKWPVNVRLTALRENHRPALWPQDMQSHHVESKTFWGEFRCRGGYVSVWMSLSSGGSC